MAGPVVPQLVQLTPKISSTSDKGIEGDIIGLDDPFGSLISNIPGDEFKKLGYVLGDKIVVQVDKKPFTVPYEKTFMDVQVGDPLLYIDSRGRIGLALNQGNFSMVNKITPPRNDFYSAEGRRDKEVMWVCYRLAQMIKARSADRNACAACSTRLAGSPR